VAELVPGHRYDWAVAPRPGELAKAIEAVVLRPTATMRDVEEACTVARRLHLAAIGVMPVHVALAAATLRGSDVKVIGLIGYPFGADTAAIKLAAAVAALDDGADEVEVMMALSAFLSGDVNAVRDELQTIVRAARRRPRPAAVRGVIETSYLDDRRVRLASRVLRKAGVDMAVTSTGLGPKAASVLDVELLREELGADIAIKAAGGVRTRSEVVDLIAAGAHRVAVASPETVLDRAGAA
jgi:deoxyribose-phosphate aldolase